MNGQWETVVGLEVHAELCTPQKLFCGCENRFGAPADSLSCPVCRGEGALPQLNGQAVAFAVRLGLALSSEINSPSYFDRKHYHYPDLPKGYQITQQRLPICQGGYLPFLCDGEERSAEIERVQLEEDTAKLSRGPAGEWLVDHNRCGVPLVEIITRPQPGSGRQAKAFLEALAATLVALGISDGRAQEGSLRADVNVSVRRWGEAQLGPRCELKNISGFLAVMHAVEAEAERQVSLLEAGGAIQPETRRWNDQKRESSFLRRKEDTLAYRYTPEPELLPLVLDASILQGQKETLPELPWQKMNRYHTAYGIPQPSAQALAYSVRESDYFKRSIEYNKCKVRTLANWVLTELPAAKRACPAESIEKNLPPQRFAALVQMVEQGELSAQAGKSLLPEMLRSGLTAKELAARQGLYQTSGQEELHAVACQALAENPRAVQDFWAGKRQALGFLVGQGMKMSKGRANPVLLRQIMAEMLAEKGPGGSCEAPVKLV